MGVREKRETSNLPPNPTFAFAPNRDPFWSSEPVRRGILYLFDTPNPNPRSKFTLLLRKRPKRYL